MDPIEFAHRPQVEVYKSKLAYAERLNQVFDRLDVVCRESGFTSYPDFIASVKNFDRSASTPPSMSKVRRAGLRGTGKRALPEDLARGKQLMAEGKSIAEISRNLGLSYPTTAKYHKRGWLSAEEWAKAQPDRPSTDKPSP
jgi:hypothetical protein